MTEYRIDFIARRWQPLSRGSSVGHGYVRLTAPDQNLSLVAGSYPSPPPEIGTSSFWDNFRRSPVPGNVQLDTFRSGSDTVIASISVSPEVYEQVRLRIKSDIDSGVRYNLLTGEHCISYMEQIAAQAGVDLLLITERDAFLKFGAGAPAGNLFLERWERKRDPNWAPNPENPRCFLAGTPILMADGQEKPIEDIRVGDMVMSFDPSADQGRGALVPKPVSRTFQNITRSIIDLRGLHMTPGHVCLTDDGRFETIAEILLRDGILVEADGTPIRARTGAKIGSMEDIPVLIAYPDEKTGKEIFVRARAGIPCLLVRERDGTMRHRSLAQMLRAYHQTLTPDGLILSPDGSLGEATDWPEDSTPMDEDYRRNWVIQTADGKPYVPEWILEVASEAREEQTVGATLRRIISPPSQRFTPRVVDNPTPPARNRAERRAQKHRKPK